VGTVLDPLWLFVAGQWSLARELGSSTPDGLGEVLSRLEDDRRMAEILCQLLPMHGSANPRAGIVLGTTSLLDPAASRDAEQGDDAVRLALVGCRWAPDAGGRTGAVALLGCDRLDYATVIPLVEYAARALSSRSHA
jgi:transcriptional regulator of heat shock response